MRDESCALAARSGGGPGRMSGHQVRDRDLEKTCEESVGQPRDGLRGDQVPDLPRIHPAILFRSIRMENGKMVEKQHSFIYSPTDLLPSGSCLSRGYLSILSLAGDIAHHKRLI